MHSKTLIVVDASRSDVYFLFRLKPLTTEIKKCEKEIAECKWMPLAEFCNLPYYQGLYAARIVAWTDISTGGKASNRSCKTMLAVSMLPGPSQRYRRW